MLYHMASMLRCGETVVLRSLAAHPSITAIGHGFEEYGRYPREEMEQSRRVFVMKQGTWKEDKPFKGFVLVRQPLAVYRSMAQYKDAEGVTGRLQRMGASMMPDLQFDGGDVDNFCKFYNRRFNELADTGLPIVRYEDFVRHPVPALLSLMDVFDLPYSDKMLVSHQGYEAGTELHSGNMGDRPIDRNSLDKWRDMEYGIAQRVVEGTRHTWMRYGYDLDQLMEVE